MWGLNFRPPISPLADLSSLKCSPLRLAAQHLDHVAQPEPAAVLAADRHRIEERRRGRPRGHRDPQEGEELLRLPAAPLAKAAGERLERRRLEGPGRRVALAAEVANRFQRLREQASDATIRRTHQYRLIAREIGRRLADRGVIDQPEDVFYLIRSELKNPPANAAELVARRRAERERLRVERPPLNFAGTYSTTRDAAGALEPGQSLQGTPVSAGVAKGRVRVLTADSMDDLEPGEVLVSAFTDTGWTPYFSFAAAVVVDTGGEMSHAAVVAREFGVPCVVGTLRGSAVLRTGDVVEVDGATGKVTRVE